MGCFEQAPNDLSSVSDYIGGNLLTVEYCVTVCYYQGSLYAGMSDMQCKCGNYFGTGGVAQFCNTPCVGNVSQRCGGNSAYSIYRTPLILNQFIPVNVSQFSYKYVGCFADYASYRDLAYQYVQTSLPMTIEYCVVNCARCGYLIVGLQAG